MGTPLIPVTRDRRGFFYITFFVALQKGPVMGIEQPVLWIEWRNPSDLKPYDGNPRINDPAVDAVAASIRAFGFQQPIVVNQAGVILAGHTRYKAALKLGLETVPVHVAAELSPAEAKAYRITDNQTARLSDWDHDRLPIELLELQQMDFDLQLTGFSPDELLQLLESPTTAGQCDPDDIPAPPDEATTKPGDLWRLGKHRLLCGDSSKPEDVDRLLHGATIHLVNTDPPYNVQVEPRSKNAIAAGLSSFASYGNADSGRCCDRKLRAKDRPLVNDFVSQEKFDQLLRAWFANIARALEPGRAFYVWGGYSNLPNYLPALAANGLFFSQAIIWNKLHPVLTRKDYMGCFELAFYGWRAGAAHKFFGPNNALDLWEIKKISPQNMVHLTEKPVELASRAMEYSSQPGENVLDLFAGSGSTLIAAEQMGRRALLMEVDPLYCDVIVERWRQFTGKEAVRENVAVVGAEPAAAEARPVIAD
jgi:DNA modification methylase